MDNYSNLYGLNEIAHSITSYAEKLCREVFGMTYDEWLRRNKAKVEAIDTENTTECDICGRPCPDGELRCCEDHDLQSYGPVDDNPEKYVDGDLEMERNRDLNFEKEKQYE